MGQQIMQIFPILILGQGFCQSYQLLFCDLFLVVGDFFETGYFESLAMFDRGDEVAGLQKTFMGAGIKPGQAPAQEFHFELSSIQIRPVNIGNFQFASGGGLLRQTLSFPMKASPMMKA